MWCALQCSGYIFVWDLNTTLKSYKQWVIVLIKKFSGSLPANLSLSHTFWPLSGHFYTFLLISLITYKRLNQFVSLTFLKSSPTIILVSWRENQFEFLWCLDWLLKKIFKCSFLLTIFANFAIIAQLSLSTQIIAQ